MNFKVLLIFQGNDISTYCIDCIDAGKSTIGKPGGAVKIKEH